MYKLMYVMRRKKYLIMKGLNLMCVNWSVSLPCENDITYVLRYGFFFVWASSLESIPPKEKNFCVISGRMFLKGG